MINRYQIEAVLRFILPFSNEIGNALTISKEGPFKRIYVPCPHSWSEFKYKNIIDTLALSGIVWNVSHIAYKFGLYKGILQGIMLIIVAFIIPNFSMEPVINYICEGDTDNTYDNDPNSSSNKCSNNTKLLVGSVFILFLFLLEYIFTNVIRKLKI